MRIVTTSLVLAASAIAQPALAQSAFPMVIGSFEQPRKGEPRKPLTSEERVEIAIDNACPEPAVRDLKGRQLHRECVTEARQQALAQLAARGTAIAAR